MCDICDCWSRAAVERAEERNHLTCEICGFQHTRENTGAWIHYKGDTYCRSHPGVMEMYNGALKLAQYKLKVDNPDAYPIVFKENVQMVEKKTWEEFRTWGMLWWINRLLHTFGWALVFDIDAEGKITEVYPARVKFRGFGEQQETEGFVAVSRFMKYTADELAAEAQE
jgi:hypothetical protein